MHCADIDLMRAASILFPHHAINTDIPVVVITNTTIYSRDQYDLGHNKEESVSILTQVDFRAHGPAAITTK